MPECLKRNLRKIRKPEFDVGRFVLFGALAKKQKIPFARKILN